MGSAFSGKYRSLFLANQGDKRERMTRLLDAISEVYASVFGPDPIAYRRERGLLDFHEEMAILIQEVVGKQTRQVFPAGGGRGRIFQQRVPLVAPDPARPTGSSVSFPVSGPAPWIVSATTTRSSRSPANPGSGSTPRSTKSCATRRGRWMSSTSKPTASRPTTSMNLLRTYGTDYPAFENGFLGPQGRRAPQTGAAAGRYRKGRSGRRSRRPRRLNALRQTRRQHPQDPRGDPRHPGGHRVRPRRHRFLPAPVPAAELRRRGCTGADPQGRAGERHPLRRPPLRLQRSGAGHHPRRLRGPRGLCRPPRTLRPPGRGRGGRQTQQTAPETPVHPHGPRALGQPGRHQARRQRRATRTSTTPRCSSKSRARPATTFPI